MTALSDRMRAVIDAPEFATLATLDPGKVRVVIRITPTRAVYSDHSSRRANSKRR